jgi:hypothetical protein
LAKKKSDRFALSEIAVGAPGQCWLTKTTVGPFIDTGVDVQFAERGRIYLSVDAVREMAIAAGLFDEYEATQEAAELDGYNRGYTEAVRENYGDALGTAVDRLAFVVGQLGMAVVEPRPEAPEGNSGIDGGVLAGEAESGDEPSEDALGISDTQPSSTEPSRRKRPAGVSANRGDGTLPRI